MAREIERKFVVVPEQLPLLENGVRFVQGYLSETPHIRFRIMDGRVCLTIKKELSPFEREEMEFERTDMSAEEIECLVSLAPWPPLVKTRYEILAHGKRWEIDVYEGENTGLVTADVELSDPDEVLVLPDWVQWESEISGDMQYANITLTRRPYSTW